MQSTYNYLLFFVLILFSGNPSIAIFGDVKWLMIIISIFVFMNNLNYLTIQHNKTLYAFLIFFMIIFCLQYFSLGFVSFLGALNFLIKITFGYVIIKKCGVHARSIYFNIIVYIAAISLVGFSLNYLGINMPIVVSESLYSILIYNQNLTQVDIFGIRNSGMFWEPGAFAIYLNLALVLFTGNLKLLFKKNKWKVSVLIITLITTFSTTGYILFFLILLHYYLFEYRKNKLISVPTAIVFLISFMYIFNSLSFLKEKIIVQYENNLFQDRNEFKPDRLGALLFDLHYIEKHPITGNGFHVSTRYIDHPWLKDLNLGHGNGFSNFIASMGIISIMFYLFYIFKFAHQNKFLILTIVVLALQGEQLLNYPLFLALPFLFKTFNEKYRCINYVSQS